MISQLTPAAGKLLISEPFMDDPNFTRSVVLLTEHGDEGALGFVINHPSLLLLDDLVAEFTGNEFPVFYGGPVAMDTLHFIHRCPDKISDGEEIAKGIYWGGNFESLKALVNQGGVTKEEVKFFVGYSGWGMDQLDQEMKGNTWIVSDQYNSDLVFSSNEEEIWREVIIHLGPKYAHISNFPQNPNLN
jgi:putative transcriptional regulator